MPLMSLSDVRVQDPVLTSVVQGYSQAELVGPFLFPEVPVTQRSGYVITFGKSDFALFDTRRAPGAATKRRTTNYSNRKFTLFQDSIEGELPIEHLEESQNAQVPIDLQEATAEGAMASIQLRLEYDIATLATDTNNYDTNNKQALSGTDRWDNSGSDPRSLMDSWKEAVRAKIGRYPNSALFGPNVFNAAKNHADLRDQIKYTSEKSITPEMLAQLFDLSRGIKIGSSLVLDETTGELMDIWGDAIILAYVPEQITTRREPSYGYTYTLKNYPVAEEPYYDRNHKTWYFPVTSERSPELTGQDAGFLVTTVVG
jgi:hypothetical protein